MHMADALLSPAVAGAMYACSFAAAGFAQQKVKKERDEKILLLPLENLFFVL